MTFSSSSNSFILFFVGHNSKYGRKSLLKITPFSNCFIIFKHHNLSKLSVLFLYIFFFRKLAELHLDDIENENQNERLYFQSSTLGVLQT